MWDTYLFSGRWYGKISAAENYQGGSDIARNIANNSLVVSHASPYLHVAIIAQSQRIGSGQTWFFLGSYAGRLTGQSNCRNRCRCLKCSYMHACMYTSTYILYKYLHMCFWWKLESLIVLLPPVWGVRCWCLNTWSCASSTQWEHNWQVFDSNWEAALWLA